MFNFPSICGDTVNIYPNDTPIRQIIRVIISISSSSTSFSVIFVSPLPSQYAVPGPTNKSLNRYPAIRVGILKIIEGQTGYSLIGRKDAEVSEIKMLI